MVSALLSPRFLGSTHLWDNGVLPQSCHLQPSAHCPHLPGPGQAAQEPQLAGLGFWEWGLPKDPGCQAGPVPVPVAGTVVDSDHMS